MFGRLSIVAAILLVSLCAARAQTPSPDAMAAARSLVTTMKLTEQLKAIMPALLQGLKPAIVQNRPEVERDFDALAPKLAEAFAPHYETMVNGIAAVYASHFTAEELREVEAFYRRPVGQKMLERLPTITQQSMQLGQSIGTKAGEELRARMTDELRKKGHNI